MPSSNHCPDADQPTSLAHVMQCGLEDCIPELDRDPKQVVLHRPDSEFQALQARKVCHRHPILDRPNIFLSKGFELHV